eukprot:CAMPEP_0170187444 /NCGR_PEP_ID=MMETSP0040_2-20121228/41748_1 /TAXON_ID=641309 /ORGANISM="Lotharella oceanica, Strain CCMP622" /LENGTH=165 /DNA_ID=CAMNT_0010434479 /DNA_START=89 /DNA_END=587 /DNA_ORIENTATION=+
MTQPLHDSLGLVTTAFGPPTHLGLALLFLPIFLVLLLNASGRKEQRFDSRFQVDESVDARDEVFNPNLLMPGFLEDDLARQGGLLTISDNVDTSTSTVDFPATDIIFHPGSTPDFEVLPPSTPDTSRNLLRPIRSSAMLNPNGRDVIVTLTSTSSTIFAICFLFK